MSYQNNQEGEEVTYTDKVKGWGKPGYPENQGQGFNQGNQGQGFILGG